ncbi:nicotinate (nicotinamide) nucleotide adenylyltransferase [Ideonella sp. 4Y11]|uniref:Probable nicotinate-nucleotide adenylyltransferase n=1 Tax=Ideonella aquatica TaxID=2824119 RepID=A0A941BLD8_9BURK|nr:nicotinate (nicotinamide) nucleotide adenylyltransferase [Ideonella aquatica]MBQ0959594.1 nicotinate (nicotinamide) nucleotide adenylyltransferase [Ideonella aquatica]
MTAPRRIGLFGGSFNPPHRAHLALARVARDTLALDELRWLPAGLPWQKPAGELAPAEHRLAMVRLLVADEPGCVVDERELQRAGPSYTVDTLTELRAEQPGAELVLVIGQDQYARIDTWRDAAQWRSWVQFAVAARHGQPPQPPADWQAGSHRLVVLPLPEHPISATHIRQQVRAGEDITPLVGPEVARYIDQHRLYRV